MVMHARKGGDLEIMGLLQGKVKGGTFERPMYKFESISLLTFDS
jgi:hypothetical protein